jgi:hypothetical protein
MTHLSLTRRGTLAACLLLAALGTGLTYAQKPAGKKPVKPEEQLFLGPINVEVPQISTDKMVRYDYDIVYVRAPRKGDKGRTQWTEIAHPALMDPGADLMLLHPDGSEERLVAGGEDGSVTDPFVSLDGESVYYSHLRGLKGTSQHGQPPFGGADIYKIHVKSRKIVRLTEQVFTPNTGAADWSSDCRKPEAGKTHLNYGVLNLGPCPLPGGRLVFVSNRNAFRPPKHPSPTLQLFVMDEDGGNVECVGHLNLGMALHPVVLTDGRILFSSLESQGLRTSIHWGLWSIHPDGSAWGPVVSAFLPGEGAPNAFHFQTQLSDGSLIAEEYYNQNNSGFGTYLKLPLQPPEGYPAFGPASTSDPRNPALRFGRHDNGRPSLRGMSFSPFGIESFTRFARPDDGPADRSVIGKKDSLAVGKFTHPSGAPDNHLLTVWSPGPANHQYNYPPEIDGGIYLIKDGKAIDEPAQMRLIKNDPDYNEQWPRALVPYRRIYGIAEPKRIEPLRNDGKRSPHLPEGTPFGLVGTSSLYKRESYPNGAPLPGGVTATWAEKKPSRDGYDGLDPFNTSENGASLNWVNQGADAGKYGNDDIHAVRILALEPTTDRNRGPKAGRLFYSHAQERLRILGEIPVRKFGGGEQPLDPDRNPDTSFLAKIPTDTVFTFQTLDRDGMVLNMAQTWHQLRPGEVRNNCGGCHAHSQKPTDFRLTAAAKPDYEVFDLTRRTPLLTAKARDESGKKWDAAEKTGLRFANGVQNVEYFRDVKPILDRSCTACHTGKGDKPAGNLVLDDDAPVNASYIGKVPGTYYRLAMDGEAKFGYRPVIHNGQWRQTNASRYVRKFQSRRSLLVWKVFGRRTDGWSNDDFPTETVPGDATTLHWKGKPISNTSENRNRADLDFTGSAMPPPEAVAGTYAGRGGKKIKVAPLTDEDRLTLVRWIDLGCPIDFDYDPKHPESRGYGWMCDDARPTLTLTYPLAGNNTPLTRIAVGMHDYYSGLDMDSFRVVADFAVDGVPAGEDLARRFRPVGQGVWEWKLDRAVAELPRGKLTVSVKDRQGNLTCIDRTFSVSKAASE